MNQPLTRIFHVETDGNGKEIRANPITLDERGRADLSQLPPEIANTLTRLGARSRGFAGNVFPEHGPQFLRALLESSNGYRRFRATVDPHLLPN